MSTVLLVEDDPAYQVAIQTVLCRAGHTVQLALTIQEMLMRLSAPQPPHLVILDWFLPGDGGSAEGLRWIRTHRELRIQTLPVLVLTASRNQAQVYRQALDAGASECLSKTASLDHVMDRVTERLAQVQPSSASVADNKCPIQLIGHQAIRSEQGAQVTLTPDQVSLLQILLERPGVIVPYTDMESRLFVFSDKADRTSRLRTGVSRLNSRLQNLGCAARASRQEKGYYLRWDHSQTTLSVRSNLDKFENCGKLSA